MDISYLEDELEALQSLVQRCRVQSAADAPDATEQAQAAAALIATVRPRRGWEHVPTLLYTAQVGGGRVSERRCPRSPRWVVHPGSKMGPRL